MPANLGELADQPLVMHEGRIFCLDITFLLTRITRELYNVSSENSFTSKDQHVNAAGRAFEKYCDQSVTRFNQNRHHAWMAPKKLLSQEYGDCLMTEGSYAAIFEYKFPPLPIKAKYSTDPEQLLEAIRSKFIFGPDPKHPKGFRQISISLRKLLNQRDRFHLLNTKKIIPCLITTEEILTDGVIYELCRRLAKPLFKEFGSLVTDPVILHSEDLIRLSERSNQISLPQMLEKLSLLNMLSEGTTINAIFKLWPDEDEGDLGAGAGRRDSFFLDEALQYLGNLRELGSNCPLCGSQRIANTYSGSGWFWYCPKCKRSIKAREEEAKELDLDYLEARSKFEET